MTAALEIRGLDETEERLRAIQRGIARTTFNGMSRAAKYLERRVKQNLAAGKPSGLTSKRTLRQSITSAAFTEGRSVVGAVGSPLVYARIHELGTQGRGGELPDIRPKNAKALTVPLGKLRGKNARAADFPDAFVWRNPRTKKVFLARSNGAHLQLLFVLKDKVAIPARPYLSTTAAEERTQIVGILAKQVEALIR